MNDTIIRNSLYTHLKTDSNSDDSVVIDEVGLNHGKIRADVLVVDESLHGYEIKSDKDSLKRLPEQVETYSRIFDYCYIVVGSKYLNKVSDLLPYWWGILHAEQTNGEDCSIRAIRSNRQKKGPCN